MSRLDFLETRERFIPIRLPILLEHILRDERLGASDREQMRALFTMMQARFHFEFHEQLNTLKEAYAPFDPDNEMRGEPDLTEAERAARRAQLFEGFRQLLIHGNYIRLTHEQLEQCLALQPMAGITVDVALDDFEQMLVFYRGAVEEEKVTTYFSLPWPLRKRKIWVLRRVALLAQTQEGQIILKLFKDIVLADLKIISPSVRLKMPLLDRLKIGGTFAGGFISAVVKLILKFAVLTPWVFAIVLSTFIGAFIKSLVTFFSCKTKYMQTLSSNLYYQNLANNESVLTRLIDAGEAEEVKEMLLAYFMLYVQRDRDLTEPELDKAVEDWLLEQFGLDIDFEVDDGLRKLREKDLLVVRPEVDAETKTTRDVLKVYDLCSALRRMDEVWDNWFLYSNEGCPSDDRLADRDWPPPVKREPAASAVQDEDAPDEDAGGDLPAAG